MSEINWENEPEEESRDPGEELPQVSVADFYDLLMEQQEQM
jgi:hypothetical protein